MKIIIHGGFFSESDQDASTKLAKQNSLKQIEHQGLFALHQQLKYNSVMKFFLVNYPI